MKYAENRHLSLVLEILLLGFVEYIHLCSNLFDKKKLMQFMILPKVSKNN